MKPSRQPDPNPTGASVLSVAMMTPDDIGQVATLFDAYRGFYGQPQDRALAEGFIRERCDREDSWILVARNGDGIVAGFCQIYPSLSSVAACRTGILNDLYVVDGERAQGVGSALLAAARALALAVGLSRLELATAHDNHRARRLYERHGWVADHQFTTYGLATTPIDPVA